MCIPEINTNYTFTSGTYKKLPFKSKKYFKVCFPKFSQLWSSLPKLLREERGFTLFKHTAQKEFQAKKKIW